MTCIGIDTSKKKNISNKFKLKDNFTDARISVLLCIKFTGIYCKFKSIVMIGSGYNG